MHQNRYRITSNLSDVSNYSDSVMKYFLPSIQSYTSITLNISCSNYTDSSLTHDHDRCAYIQCTYVHGSMINKGTYEGVYGSQLALSLFLVIATF